MKYSIIIIIAALLFGMTITANAQSKTTDNFSVQVDGLGCPFCAYGLEKKFKEFKGIKKVAIEMETGMMTFTYPSEKGLSIEKIEKQVEVAGYTPVSVEIERADGRVESTKTAATEISAESKVEEASFFAAGNCGMCQARIENAAGKVAGVTEASWDKETQQVSITFDTTQTSKAAVEKAVATSGHDTKTAKADKETYNNLPGCCQYDRAQ